MASKRKFKRDYIILEAKDTNFRYKERILPKAFAKVEINDEKSIVSLYVENLKCVKDGYRVVAIQSDYETLDLGRVVLSDQGKGEFVLNLEKDDIEIKGIALLHEKSVPLIGFKGSKIDNYEEILFAGEDNYGDEDEYEEYEEVEYIEIEDGEDFDEYEEIEYIEIEEDDDVEEQNDYDDYNDIDDEEYEYEEERNDEYEEYDNVKETIDRNLYQQKPQQSPTQKQKQQGRVKNMPQYQQPRSQYMPENPYENMQTKNQSQTSKTAGSLLMPRQIKKGLKYFNEVKPFVTDDIDDTRWWKIEISPNTLCGYTMPYLGYVNSLNYTMYSDSVMHSYKYRHYLFGVQYDEYNKRKHYIYAVPGHKNEQPDKGHTGFNTYQPCDTRNDSLGYWLCFIDSRTRRIIK